MGFKETITKIYVGYFDRAPDPVGLQYWIDRMEAGMTTAEVAQSFSVQPEATAKYPYLVTPDVISPKSFINDIYQNLFNRAPDAAGEAYWLAELASGKPVGQMIIDIISGAQDDAVNKDLTTLNNKVAVGIDWAEDVGALTGFSYETNAAAKASAADVLDGVTETDASVTAAKAKTDAYTNVENGTAAYLAAKATYDNAAAAAATDATTASDANAAYDTAAATVSTKAEADAAKVLADVSKDAADTALTAANGAKAKADAAKAAADASTNAADDVEAAGLVTAAEALVAAANQAVADAASDSAAANDAVAVADYDLAKAQAATDATAATDAKTLADNANTAYDTAAAAVVTKADADAAKTLADTYKALADAAVIAATTAKTSADAAAVAAAATQSTTDDGDAQTAATAAADALTAANALATDANADVAAAANAVTTLTPNSFTLTANSDVIGGPNGMIGSNGSNGTGGDDVIIAGLSNVGPGTTNNLGTGDVINAGAGNDVLNIIDQNSLIIPALTSVETVNVQAVGTTGTTLNLVNATGITHLTNDRSTDATGLTLNNVQGEVTVNATGTSTNTTVNYFGTANVGTDHNFVFNGATLGANIALTGGNVAGVTTANVVSSGSANSGTLSITGAGLQTLNVTGDQNLVLDDTGGLFNSLTAVNANGLGANLTLDLTTGGPNANAINIMGATGVNTLTLSTGNATVNTGAANDLIHSLSGGNNTINTGDGNDRVNMGGTFTNADTLDGGDGTDTVSVGTIAHIDAVDAPTASNFEVLAFTSVTSGNLDVNGTGANATTLPTSINTFSFEGGINGDTSLTDLQDNATVNLMGPSANTHTLLLDHENDTSSNVLNFGWSGGANQTLGTLSTPDAETLNIDINETAADRGLTINNLNAPDLNGATLTITGDGNLTIVDGAASGLTSVNASASTGNIDVAGIFGDAANNGLQDVFSGTSNISITTGGGADRVTGVNNAARVDTINTGAGNDIIIATTGADVMTLGAGSDVIGYTALAQSSAAAVDTVTDFVSGTDQFDFTQLLGGNATFVGNFANFGAAQGAVNNGGAVEAVFQQDTNSLWVDVNNDGTLNANDLQIKLSGISTLVQADINGNTAFPNNILLTAPSANAQTGVNTLNGATTSASNDIISSTDANLNGSTVNGQAGSDILNVTTQATAANFNSAVISNTETINLTAGSTAINTNNVDGNLAVLNANATTDVTIDANNAGITFNGSAGADTFQLGNVDFTGTLVGNGGVDILTSTGGDISGANAGATTTFETFSQVAAGDTAMTVTQHNAFTNINGSVGNNVISISDVGTLTGDADIETYSVQGGSTFTLGAAGQNVTESSVGATTVNIGSQTITGTFSGFESNDILNATGGANIAGAANADDFGRLDLVGGITMTAAQHEAIIADNGIVASGASDQVNIASANYGTITTDADVETYVLGDDTAGNAIAVEVNSAGHIVQTFSANDEIDYTLANTITNFTGTLVGGGAGTDEFSTGTQTTINISNATLTNIEELDLNGTNTNITLTNAQLGSFTNDISTTGALSTATITDNATITVDDATVLGRGDFLNYVLQGTGTDVIEFEMENNDAALNTVDISAGGADDIRLNNDSTEGNATSVDFVTITGFTAGDDDLDLEVGATNISGAASYASIATGSNTNVTGAVNGIIEIAGAPSISAATAADTTNGGNVELAIAAAIGTVTNGGEYGVTLTDGTHSYVYTATLTGAADAVAGNMSVELVAVVNNVGLGAFTAGDFI